MWIGEYSGARDFRAALLAPDPPEPKEEALLGRVAIDLLTLFARLVIGNHVLERHQGDARAAVVSGIFTESEPAIQLDVINRNEIRIFIGHATDALFKLLAVLLSPPIAQVARRIILAAL